MYNIKRDQATSLLTSTKWSLSGDDLVSKIDGEWTLVTKLKSTPAILFTVGSVGSATNQFVYRSKRSLWEVITFKTDPALTIFDRLKNELIDEKIKFLTLK